MSDEMSNSGNDNLNPFNHASAPSPAPPSEEIVPPRPAMRPTGWVENEQHGNAELSRQSTRNYSHAYEDDEPPPYSLYANGPQGGDNVSVRAGLHGTIHSIIYDSSQSATAAMWQSEPTASSSTDPPPPLYPTWTQDTANTPPYVSDNAKAQFAQDKAIQRPPLAHPSQPMTAPPRPPQPYMPNPQFGSTRPITSTSGQSGSNQNAPYSGPMLQSRMSSGALGIDQIPPCQGGIWIFKDLPPLAVLPELKPSTRYSARQQDMAEINKIANELSQLHKNTVQEYQAGNSKNDEMFHREINRIKALDTVNKGVSAVTSLLGSKDQSRRMKQKAERDVQLAAENQAALERYYVNRNRLYNKLAEQEKMLCERFIAAEMALLQRCHGYEMKKLDKTHRRGREKRHRKRGKRGQHANERMASNQVEGSKLELVDEQTRERDGVLQRQTQRLEALKEEHSQRLALVDTFYRKYKNEPLSMSTGATQ